MALILDGNGLIQGLSAGGLPDGSIDADSLASTLDLSSKTMTFGNVTASGITFPASVSASSNPNTLDDYEEGDWTPTITGSSSNPTVTYTQQRGRYTKIGRIVSVTCQISTSALSGGSGDLRISGLPFTCGFPTWAGGAMAYNSTGSVTPPDICMVGAGSTIFGFWAGVTAVTLGTISAVDWYFSATYNV